MEVSDLIESVDILDYVSQYCDFEKKNGEYWALSPLKDENTPSFSIDVDKQCYYDFSSGSGGNILSFIMNYNQCDIYRAIDILKKYANVGDELNQPTRRLESTKVIKRFRNTKQIKQKGGGKIIEPDYMDRYDFDIEKLDTWIAEGISVDVLKKHGVKYDKFSNRIVYPIYDMDGNLINVSGRTLDPEFKEKKIRKYTYFTSLGDLNTVYWLFQNMKTVKEKHEVILFEGAKSVMIAEGWGVNNTGAILTSHINPQQLKILIKLGVRVVFALDEDVDVSKDDNINRLKRFVPIEVVKNFNNILESKMSPVDRGKEMWELLYERRKRIN